MPVWAAIVATCSIPEFYAPLHDREEWEKKDKDFNLGLREVKKFFREKINLTNHLESADFLTKIAPYKFLSGNINLSANNFPR